MKSSDILIRAISQEMPQPSITKIGLKITCLKFHSNYPGANELIPHGSVSLCDVAFGLLRSWFLRCPSSQYSDVIMSTMASQITSLSIVYSTVYSGTDQRKHQSSASLAIVLGIHGWLLNSPHKGPVMRKMFPFDDVIMSSFNSKWLPCASA